jgi:hypothetical protein
MARLKLTKLPENGLRITVVEQMGGTDVETPLEGIMNVVWSAGAQGMFFQLTFAPDAVTIAEGAPVQEPGHGGEVKTQQPN